MKTKRQKVSDMIIPQTHTIAWRIRDIFLQQLAVISKWALGMFRWAFCTVKLLFGAASWLERLNALETQSRNTNSLAIEATTFKRPTSYIQTRSIKRTASFKTKKGEYYITKGQFAFKLQFW